MSFGLPTFGGVGNFPSSFSSFGSALGGGLGYSGFNPGYGGIGGLGSSLGGFGNSLAYSNPGFGFGGTGGFGSGGFGGGFGGIGGGFGGIGGGFGGIGGGFGGIGGGFGGTTSGGDPFSAIAGIFLQQRAISGQIRAQEVIAASQQNWSNAGAFSAMSTPPTIVPRIVV